MNVKFQNVTYKRKKFCLQNLSFTIREGFITALTGPNGAGKTALCHLLLDKNARYEGSILADDTEWRQNRIARMNRIGFVSDEQRFFMELTAMENVRLLHCLYDEFSEDKFQESMEKMQLSVHRYLRDMSRGEYIKYQLAFAMSHKTRLYLLDEASAGMDPVFKKDFFRMLHELLMADEQCSVLFSTHIQEDIRKHMDYVIYLEQGRVLSECEAGEFNAGTAFENQADRRNFNTETAFEKQADAEKERTAVHGQS